MKHEHGQDEILKKYLLNDLDAQEIIESIEQRLLFVNDFLEEIELSEDELIDDYLSGALLERERSQFEKHFLCSTDRQNKLRFAKNIRNYVQDTVQPVIDLPVSEEVIRED